MEKGETENTKTGQFMSRYKEWKEQKMSTTVKPLQDKNSRTSIRQKPPCGEVKTTTKKRVSVNPAVHIETNVAKPQEELSMRERLATWKEEKKRKEIELKSKAKGPQKRPAYSAPPSVQKKDIVGKRTGPSQPTVPKVERRSTFSVRSGSKLFHGEPKTSGAGASNVKPNEKKIAPRVSVKKPVLVVSSTFQKSAGAHSRGLPHVEARRHTTFQRRRLSAGLSKRPVGILKRRSCVPAMTSTSCAVETSATTTEQKSGEHTVKFLTPSQTPQHHSTYRKTPSTSKENISSDSMRHKLNCWLQAKGKTPSKFRHLMCFDAAMSERKKKDRQMTRSITVEGLSKQQEKMASENTVCQNLLSQFEESIAAESPRGIAEQLDELLTECHHLIDTGCPVNTLLGWLTNIYNNIPLAKYYTPFYRCKVEAVKKHGSHSDVIDVMSQAIINSAQPSSELASLNATVMKELLSQALVPALIIDTAATVEHMETETIHSTGELTVVPKQACCQETVNTLEEEQKMPDQELMGGENKMEEAPFIVQYAVTNVTPFKKRKRASSLCTPQQTVVTPVRRSTRRSIQLQPNITDSEKVVRSISELSESEKTSALFRPNHALDDVLEKFQ